MNNIAKNLDEILSQSGLASLFTLKLADDRTNQVNPFFSYRVKTNIYKIRAFELWGVGKEAFFRIYYSNQINNKLKEQFISIGDVINNKANFMDYRCNNYLNLAIKIKNILSNNDVIKECKDTSNIARTSKFEGLDLPDIDTSLDEVMGQTFTWRDIISIWEDTSENNKLKERLSQRGIYIQRSKDGKSRYIGSAYGEGGIIGRWMKHLDHNGNAQHLNLFILENGYNEIVFSVIEFYPGEDIIQRENMWKQILGTVNYGPYNGLQLNNN